MQIIRSNTAEYYTYRDLCASLVASSGVDMELRTWSLARNAKRYRRGQGVNSATLKRYITTSTFVAKWEKILGRDHVIGTRFVRDKRYWDDAFQT